MSEALKMIKREFGPQAVILSARDIHRRKGLLGLLKFSGVEVTAATDPATNNGNAKRVDFTAKQWALQKGASVRSKSKKQPVSRLSYPVQFSEKRYRKKWVSTENGRNSVQKSDHLIEVLNLYEELLNQGVKETIVSTLIEKLRDGLSPDEGLGDRALKERLKHALKDLCRADHMNPDGKERPRVVVLVGPTGVGKTTTLAKIAVVERYQNGKDIALITLNDHRIGASAQMEAYGKIFNVPVRVISEVNGLRSCLRQFRDKDLILVDTPGISHKDTKGINELKSLLTGVDALEVHLLVTAGTKEKDIERIFREFRILPVDMLLFTKIDETGEYGTMINAMVRTKLPLSYMTNGQQVPEDLEPGSIDRIVDLIWTERRTHRHHLPESGPSALPGTSLMQKIGRNDGVYVANKNSDLFHHPSCKWVERISERNMRVFRSREEAAASNFHPCRACEHLSINEEGAPTSVKTSYGAMRETGVV